MIVNIRLPYSYKKYLNTRNKQKHLLPAVGVFVVYLPYFYTNPIKKVIKMTWSPCKQRLIGKITYFQQKTFYSLNKELIIY